MKSEFIQISTTCDRREILEQIAAKLVGGRTAACCQLEGPVTSVYRWEEKTESASEYRLLIKTTTELFSAVEASVIELHSYHCLLYTSPSPRDKRQSRMPSSA